MPNESSQSAFSKRAVIGALGAMGGTAVALVPILKDVSMVGVSRLLVIVFEIVFAALVARHLIHILDGYYRAGLRRPMRFELGVTAAVATMAWVLHESENPQIPRLTVCGAAAALLFLWSAGKMEEARAAAMTGNDVEARRASDFLRASLPWQVLCGLVGQIHFHWVRRLREFFGGPDTPTGVLSLLAAIGVVVLMTVSLISAGLVIASVIFPIQITPRGVRKEDGPQAEVSPGKPHDHPSEPKGGSPGSAEECSESHGPGAGAPEPESASLRLGWEEVDGTEPGPMEALGFEIAGCPGTARPVPGQPGSWYEPGYCGGELRSIMIAPRGLEHPVVMIEQAAEFTLPIILDGRFVHAVDRFEVGGGDAYIVNTDEGSFVLIRDHTTTGPIADDLSPGGGCADFTDADVRYTVVGPGLLEAWRFIAGISVGGAYPIAYAHKADGSEWVDFRSPEGIMAKGSCVIETMVCKIKVGEDEISGRNGDTITESEVKALVEP